MLACTARLPAAHPAAVGALGGPRWGEHLAFSLLHTLLDTHAEPSPPLPPPEYPSRTQSCFPVLWPSPPLLLPLPGSELRVWFSKSLLILRSPILGRQGCIYPREQQLATLQVPFPTATRLPGHELGLRQWGGMAGPMVGGGRGGGGRGWPDLLAWKQERKGSWWSPYIRAQLPRRRTEDPVGFLFQTPHLLTFTWL